VANRHGKCESCLLRHRPDRGCAEGRPGGDRLSQGNGLQSIGILASDLSRFLGARGVSVYRDPFSLRAEEIARRAIERADAHGMDQYGPAPAPLDEKRDMIQEAVEELLDAIYYQIRQVARLQDLRERLAAADGGTR
jgi:hypothetical protein